MIALLAPGQGAQKPGMLAPWLDDPEARGRLRACSDAAGLDLRAPRHQADADAIKDTAVTQPLLVASALLAWDQLRLDVTCPDDAVVAGHSVGELAAAAIAERHRRRAAVALAAVRGREMAAACAEEPTSMAAVLGGDADAVLARLAELGLEPANRNGAGQVVAAGRKDAIDALVENPPEGARVRALSVAGAFHTRFMEPAEKALGTWVGEHRDQLAPADPLAPAAVQRRRRGRHRRRRGPAPPRRPGDALGALGRLHGRRSPRAGVDRRHRAAAGGHAGRAGQARAQGHGHPRREDPGRPGEGRADRRSGSTR